MLLLSSQSFPHYGLERFFGFASKLNFDGVEICISDNFDTQNPEYLKYLEKKYDISIKAFSLPNRDGDKYMAVFERVVAEFPGSLINLASPEVFSYSYKRWLDFTVPRLVKRHRLIFARRNTPFKTIFGFVPARSESSLHELRGKGDVSLDLSALWKSTEDIMRSASFLAEKLQHVYLSNVNHGLMYSPLPTGILPVESFLTKLARENYRGMFTLKIAPENMHEGDDQRMLKTLKESKEFFEKYFVFHPEE